MMGIAAGMPQRTRLGDILVPTERHGILQTDYGKERPEGLQRTALPHLPSARLVRVDRQLETDELSGKRPWEEVIKSAIRRLGKKEWGRPGPEKDPELEGKYQKPRVVRGPIASGNQVVKVEKLRDELAALGFVGIEMENAGVGDAAWNAGRDAFYVRGVCDYGDTRKDDAWHHYAAIAAASYAVTMVTYLPGIPSKWNKKYSDLYKEEYKSTAARKMDEKIEKMRQKKTGIIVPEQVVKPREGFHSIPYEKNINFVGRKEFLAQIDENLERDGTLVISGMPGSGKTEVAARYAHEQKEKYPYVFWVNGDSREQLEAGMFKIANILGFASLGVPKESLMIKVQEWLEKSNDYLLVVDSANNLDRLPEVLPTTRGGKLLITTYKDESYPGGQNIKLPHLSDEEALRLLQQRAGRVFGDEQDKIHAENLVARFGGHALAISQAGAYVGTTGRTFEEYKGLLGRSRQKTLAAGMPTGERYNKSVAESFAVALSEIRKNEEAYEALKLFALMDPPFIPRPLVDEIGIADTAIALLRQYHMVEIQPEGKVVIHPLVQALVQDDLTDEEKKKHAKIMLAALNKYLEFLRSSRGLINKKSWDGLKDLLSYAPLCQSLAKEYQLSEGGETLFHFGDKEDYIYSNPESAKRLYQAGINLATPSLNRTKHQVKLVAMEQKFDEAVKAINEYMPLATSKGEAPTLKRNLMNLQYHTGNYAEARKLVDELLPEVEAALKEASPAMENFLILEGSIQVLLKAGEKDQAATLLDKLSDIYNGWDNNDMKKYIDQKDNLPWESKEAPVEATARLRLSMLSDDPEQAQQQNQQVEELYQKALAAYIKELGSDDHYLVGKLYEKMAEHYQVMKDSRAQAFFRKAEAIYERFFPPNHRLVENIKKRLRNENDKNQRSPDLG